MFAKSQEIVKVQLFILHQPPPILSLPLLGPPFHMVYFKSPVRDDSRTKPSKILQGWAKFLEKVVRRRAPVYLKLHKFLHSWMTRA